MHNRIAFTLLLTLLASAGEAIAQKFDWSLLEGRWAESTSGQFGCRSDNLHHRFDVSADKKTLTFKLDRKWRIGTGQEVEQYSAAVTAEKPNALIIRYGPELSGLSEEMREWEMRFIGPSTYRWRSTAWSEGEYNQVIGVKCR